ncbi:MAG: N-acetylmuramoyl-L-alanine amidase [Flavobacteriaceae bacterium]|nr:N-acetylmuramoyl-L-alanine amidase [Flavobacteriaceae bacterium]
MRINKFLIRATLTVILTLFFIPAYAQKKKFTVILDAGHGGQDIGATRTYSELGKLNEKDITLAVTLLVGEKLEKNKDFKVIYTRKTDSYPSLTERTNLANKTKADLFVSMHCNSSRGTEANGTETFVQGPNQNKENLEVAKAENDVIYLDEQDRETFASYDPNSPESLIALKIQQSKYLESSLLVGSFVEENFVNKDKRFSRGVKQQNLHVLRRNAMPSILIEMGFISNYNEAQYMASSQGQKEIEESIYQAIVSYKKRLDRNVKAEPVKEVEKPMKTDSRILLMSSVTKYDEGDPSFRGLKYILTIKDGSMYRYYYSTTNYASIRDENLKTAKDAGFKNATVVSFTPDQKLSQGYYTIELAASPSKLPKDSPVNKIPDVKREKVGDMHCYTVGNVKTLEEAVKLRKQMEEQGIKNPVIQKKNK